MFLTAKWLLTGATPPIQDAAILIEGETIREIGTRRWFARKDIGGVVDLGDSILIPGLVNAHCHLDHSALKGKIAPKTPFSDWVRQLQELSSKFPPLEKERGIKNGIQELIRGGTTTLVDHRSPETGPIETPFREFVFLEVLGADRERAAASLQACYKQTDGVPTPHSLYAVHREILEELVSPPSAPPLKLRGGKGGVMSFHILESEEEDDFFRKGTGPLADLVKERGGTLPFPADSPISWLKENDFLQAGLLIVHGNYLTEAEIQLLRGSGATVIHCPGSRRYFGHRRPPLERLGLADLSIALGTDSLASGDSLSMLRQMKMMREDSSYGEEEILRMATLNGAAALGLDHEIGTIEVGKKADIVGVPLLNQEVDPYEAMLLPDEVNFSMIGGRVLRTDL